MSTTGRFWVSPEARLIENPNAVFRELGFEAPPGIRYVVPTPSERIIPLHRFDKATKEEKELINPSPAPPNALISIPVTWSNITHWSSNWLPQGHRGDDTHTMKIRPGMKIQNVIVGNSTPWGNISGVSPSGWEVNGDELTVRVHWWFNGWSRVAYTFFVWADGFPTPAIEPVIGSFDAMLHGYWYFDYPPDWKLHTAWDPPVGY